MVDTSRTIVGFKSKWLSLDLGLSFGQLIHSPCRLSLGLFPADDRLGLLANIHSGGAMEFPNRCSA